MTDRKDNGDPSDCGLICIETVIPGHSHNAVDAAFSWRSISRTILNDGNTIDIRSNCENFSEID